VPQAKRDALVLRRFRLVTVSGGRAVGRGSAIGAVFGALAFRTIGDLLFVFDFDPLWQPLFQGVVLLLAVSISAFGLLRVRNRLEWFG